MLSVIINNMAIAIEATKTDIPGLTFLPRMTQLGNDEDWPFITCSSEVSTQNFELMDRVCKPYMTHGVVEIGVSRNGMASFTQALLQNKPDHVKYLGIDINDKTYLDDKEKNIYTIKESSSNRQTVKDYMKEIGMEKISLLFIDGWHSLNQVINDWMFTELLSEDGIVVFHDTNYHPGPAVFIEAIDHSQYRVEKHFSNQDDYGMAIAYKKNTAQ